MRKDERGTILIEFVGSFLLFVLLILSILSLVNIGTMQARMHYAMTQTANTLSMYGYMLHVAGMDEPMINAAKGAQYVQSEANGVIDEINGVLDGINNFGLTGIQKSGEAAVDRISGWVDNTRENPKQTLQLLAQYAMREVGSAGFELILRPLMEHHLSNGEMNADEYLRSVGVDGVDSLEFYTLSTPGYSPAGGREIVGSFTGIPADDSILLDGDGNVKITVQYDMKYSFMGLNKLLPFEEPKLRITQSVMTKMWLGGWGEGYNE